MTPIVIRRMDGGPRLVIEQPAELAYDFFHLDPSSNSPKAFDARAGQGDPNRISTEDVRAVNETMRARTRHSAWAAIVGTVDPSPWLEKLDTAWDLIETPPEVWDQAGATTLAAAAVEACKVPYVGISVGTKVLHLKRPRIFPVLDSLVLEQIGGLGRPVERLLDHVRATGRENLAALQGVQSAVGERGYTRTLVRILDGLLWASHPSAGLTAKLGRWERVVRLADQEG